VTYFVVVSLGNNPKNKFLENLTLEINLADVSIQSPKITLTMEDEKINALKQ